MGTLRLLSSALGLLALAAACPAHAQEAAPIELWLLPVEGTVRPGDVVTLEIAASTEGSPWITTELPQVRIDGGTAVGQIVATAPGRWQTRWRLPTTAAVGHTLGARVALGELEQTIGLAVTAATPSALRLPERLDHTAARGVAVDIPVTSSQLPPPQHLQVAVGEGSIKAIEPGHDQLTLSWLPVDDPMPRVVPILVRDARQPRRAPAQATIRMIGRPRIPIETDPGAQVSLSIGGRSYGPFLADEAGVAVASVDVFPGESKAEVVARDELGNERRTRIALGGSASPALLMLAESALVPGQPLPEIHVSAVRGDGRAWTGEAPTCRTAVGAPLSLAGSAPGLWRASLPPGVEAIFDLRVECTLAGQARATLDLPVEPGVPAAVRLRVWPLEIDADLPAAQVQAWLEGPLGDRLPAQGIVLQAQRGALVVEEGSPAVVVATYDGNDAVAAGRDRISAHWTPPSGEGGVWRLAAGLTGPPAADGDLPLVVQAQDRLGRPLEGASVIVSTGAGDIGGRTDAQGRVALDVPAAPGDGPWAVRVRAGDIEHRHMVFAADAETPEMLPGADLRALVELPVRTGDVRRIVVSAQPDRIAAGGSESARVVISLQDQSGHAITDVVPRIEASEGRVGRVRLGDDGVFEADYTPPARKAYGMVDLEVSGPEDQWSAHTRVEIAPRELRHALILHGGWILGAGQISSPTGGLTYEARLPLLPSAFLGRLGVSAYGESSTVADEVTGETVQVDVTVLPIVAALVGRQQLGRLAVFGGAGLLVAPYRQVSTYGDRIATRAPGLATPGPELLGGVSWRVGSTEVEAQFSYLYVSVPPGDVGFEGLVGGFRPSLGWKILF